MSCSLRDPENQQSSPPLARQTQGFQGAQVGSHSDNEDPEDPFPEEEEMFLGPDGKAQVPEDPSGKLSARPLASACRRAYHASSGASLDTSSEGSPAASPSSPKRNFFTRHQSFTKWERSKPHRELKKHSLSFSFPSPPRVLVPAPSVSSVQCKGFPRDQAPTRAKKEARLAGRIVQESLWDMQGPEAPDSCSQRELRHVDQQRPGSPPSYQEAIQGQTSDLEVCGCRTVSSMRARMLSLDANHPRQLSVQHGQEALDGHAKCPRTGSGKPSGTVCVSADTTEAETGTWWPELPQLRTVTESKPTAKRDFIQRCSQPVFEAEQFQYAKESYI